MRDERLLRATSNGLLGLQGIPRRQVTDAARFILIRGKYDLCTRVFMSYRLIYYQDIKVGVPLKVLRIVTE